MSKLTQILKENLDYRGHLSNFRAENTTKNGLFNTENDAQIIR